MVLFSFTAFFITTAPKKPLNTYFLGLLIDVVTKYNNINLKMNCTKPVLSEVQLSIGI